MYQLTYQCN